ncbi:MAG: PilN domain-containing protein [Candidatus Kerfeldbacteria bacterium]|nr:PilN domain-containing protein [Candidatus Kerfeldbacteria bacterium]
MIELNLLPDAYRQTHGKRRHLHALLHLSVLAGIGVVVTFALLIGTRMFLHQYLETIERDIQSSQSSVVGQSTKAIDERMQTFNARIGELADIQERHIAWIPIVQETAALIPSQITVQQLQLDAEGQTVDLSGIASTRADLLQLATNLASARLFTNVEYPISLLTEPENINFTMTLTFAPDVVTPEETP